MYFENGNQVWTYSLVNKIVEFISVVIIWTSKFRVNHKIVKLSYDRKSKCSVIIDTSSVRELFACRRIFTLLSSWKQRKNILEMGEN